MPPQLSSPIDVQAAATAAKAFFQKLSEETMYSLQVEEVEKGSDGNWLITLGYTVFGGGHQQRYKVFKVNARTGEIMYMKLRPVT